MSKGIDKILSSRITTAALIGAVILAGVILSGGGGLFKKNAGDPAPLSVAATPPAASDEKTNGTEPAMVVAEDETATPDRASTEDASLQAAADNAGPLPAAPVETAEAPADNAAAASEPVSESQPEPKPILVAAASDPGGANSFNRLLKKPSSAPNARPARDGIHDPSNPGTALLQWPSVAFEGLPKTSDGNKVDWVKALKENKISPRYKADDPNAEPFLLDLNIVRQVKGSMPNVVYPHLQHTQWLDCSNCHDEIFVPQKGANQISMAGILLGQKCGVCHGKVAFPVSDCRRCHSQPKTAEELNALADRSNWATDKK